MIRAFAFLGIVTCVCLINLMCKAYKRRQLEERLENRLREAYENSKVALSIYDAELTQNKKLPKIDQTNDSFFH